MSKFFAQLVEQMFVGPLWPASVLVCLLIAYTIMAMVGLIDFGLDVPELDLDLDAEIDLPTDGIPVDWDFWQGIGAVSVRWTNFGRVPVIIWGGIFAFVYWSISYLIWHAYDSHRYDPTWLPSSLLATRNLVIATLVTKAATEPLIKYFVAGPSYGQSTLIGATCEISTTEATPNSGQAKFRTNAAPLLLNVRTDGPHINKGTEVKIVDFDREQRIYKVTHLPAEPSS